MASNILAPLGGIVIVVAIIALLASMFCLNRFCCWYDGADDTNLDNDEAIELEGINQVVYMGAENGMESSEGCR